MKRILLTALATLVLAAPALADESWWINEHPDLAQRIPLAETPTPPSRPMSEIPVASAPTKGDVTVNAD
jgi:hypothetical protein